MGPTGAPINRGGVAAIAPKIAPVVVSEAPTKPNYARNDGGFPLMLRGAVWQDLSLLNLICHLRVALLKSREAKLLFECEAALVEAVRLREKLEVSRAEVALLQTSLQEGDVRSLAVAEYLCSDIYRCREEFERSHYSQSGYMRALSDVTVLYPSIDLSVLYRAPDRAVSESLDPL
ncbi:hypothetical protein ACLOJK_014549, partial [Asimina triloba]